MHVQAQVNEEFHKRFRQREEMDPLYYEVVHNLVLEITRLGIEVHNLKMRVESVSSRLDFDERRGRSLESVVEYRRDALPRNPSMAAPAQAPQPGGQPQVSGGRPDGARPEGEGERRRRRRRRRRRPGQTGAEQPGSAGSAGSSAPPAASGSGPGPETRGESSGGSTADDFDDGDSDQ
jgi:hypothetical protein